jgi:ABC-type multidrug transport system ATPase subunit
LHDLRRSIVIIPQEPLIFSGSVRRNLDPLDEYTEKQCWDALRDAHLYDAVKLLANEIESDAENAFSVGQKQLLCLARAVLRNPHILVLDEVTANVDVETDHLIQQTIKAKFARCSTMTIAHRLDTIIDSDKVLVMEKGELAEYDHPHVLLQNPDGIFYSLVHNDKEKAASLEKIAAKNWDDGGEELAQLRQKISSGDGNKAELEEQAQKLQDKLQKRLEEEAKARRDQEAQDLAKARQEAVPSNIRDAASDIIAEIERMDKDMREHAGSDKAKLAMEEMWKVMAEVRDTMRSTYFWRQEVQPRINAARQDESSSQMSTPMSSRSFSLREPAPTFSQPGDALRLGGSWAPNIVQNYMPESRDRDDNKMFVVKRVRTDLCEADPAQSQPDLRTSAGGETSGGFRFEESGAADAEAKARARIKTIS